MSDTSTTTNLTDRASEFVLQGGDEEEAATLVAELAAEVKSLRATVQRITQEDFRWSDTPAGCVAFRAQVHSMLVKSDV